MKSPSLLYGAEVLFFGIALIHKQTILVNQLFICELIKVEIGWHRVFVRPLNRSSRGVFFSIKKFDVNPLIQKKREEKHYERNDGN